MNEKNIMRRAHIVKCVVSIGVGEGGERLQRAKTVLEKLTEQKPVETISKTTNADLGIRKGQTIGCKLTLRKKKAYDFIKRAFWVRQNTIWEDSFDTFGNLSFGITDHTDFEGLSYDPKIGIFGMDIAIELSRKGERIKNRKLQKKKIPQNHKLTHEEGIEFIEKAFSVKVIE